MSALGMKIWLEKDARKTGEIGFSKACLVRRKGDLLWRDPSRIVVTSTTVLCRAIHPLGPFVPMLKLAVPRAEWSHDFVGNVMEFAFGGDTYQVKRIKQADFEEALAD